MEADITESFCGYNLFNDTEEANKREVNTFMHTEESPVGCEDTKDFVEPDEDLSNFQCREMSPPDPEIQRFIEPLGILPSCHSPPIENREDGRKVRNEEEHEKDQEYVKNLFNEMAFNTMENGLPNGGVPAI